MRVPHWPTDEEEALHAAARANDPDAMADIAREDEYGPVMTREELERELGWKLDDPPDAAAE